MKIVNIFFMTLLLAVFLSFKCGAYESVAHKQHLVLQGDINSRKTGTYAGYPEVSYKIAKDLNNNQSLTNKTGAWRNRAETTIEPLGLSLRDFILLVREKNEQIRFQALEWGISRESVKGAKAIYEPEFVSNYLHEDTRQRQTVRELVSTDLATPIFKEKADNYEAAIEGLVASGARLRLGYSLRSSHDVFDSQFGVDKEYKTFLGGTITQPLLKGWGIKTNRAGIRVAERDADIAFQTYREQMMRVVAEAIAAYWDLYLTQEKYMVRQDSVEIAEKVLRDNIVRVQTGKMAETEVLEAKAGLALRESLLSEARQAIVAVMNNVRTLFSSSAAEKEIEIVAIDKLEIKKVEVDFANSLLKAFKLRADYLSSRKKIEREDIKLAFAKNQRWPQLDIEGSYGLNGLAQSFSDSWDDATDGDLPTWTVGIKLRIPLVADIKARSEMNAAKKRKKQALLELKAVEVALANQVDTAIQSVYSAREQVSQHARVVDFNKRLLEVEIARFKAGKSNSRLLLEKEEDLLRAKEAELDSLVKYKKIILELGLAEGSLLHSHGIDIMDGDI